MILSDYFNLTKSHFSLSSIFKMSLSNMLTKKIRLIFVLLLFTMSLIFVCIGTSFSFYNMGKVAVNAFNQTGITTIPLENYQYSIAPSGQVNHKESISDEEIDDFQKNYPLIQFVKSIMAYSEGNLLNFQESPKSLLDATNFTKITILDNNETIFPLVARSYPKNTGDVMVTDYMASMIVKYQLISGVKAAEDLIGKDIGSSLGKEPLIVTGIVKTDYEKYDYLNEESILEESGFLDQQTQIYQQMFMSQATYDETFQYSYLYLPTGQMQYIMTIPNNNIIKANLIGKMPSKDNEIDIAWSQLYHFVTENPQDTGLPSYLSNYLNSTITLDLSAYGLANEQFTIVGIYDDIDLSDYSSMFYFMFTRNVLDYLDTHYIGQNQLITLTAYLGNNKSENQSFVYSLSGSTVRHVTIFSDQFYSLRDSMKTTSNITDIIGLVFSLFASLLLFTFISNNINIKQKEIGLLRALGTKKFDIMKIYLIESLFILLIVNILSYIASVFIIRWVNKMSSLDWHFVVQFFYVNIESVFFTILLSLIIIVISTFLPLAKISKSTAINLRRKSV